MVKIDCLTCNFTSKKANITDNSKNAETSKNSNKSTILTGSLAGLIAFSIAGAIYTRKDKTNFFKVLKKQGLELKNGIIVSSQNNEKYTGTIKFNNKAFGLEKGTMLYKDGQIVEFLFHNCFGKEVRGIFYKDNKPFIKVGNITRNKHKQYYPIYTYNEKTKTTNVQEGVSNPKESVFDKIRETIAQM